MEILIALLMACGAIAYPVYVDIRRHGTDNILRRSARDVLDWQPVASVNAKIDRRRRLITQSLDRAWRRFVDRVVTFVKGLITVALLGLAVWLVWHFFSR